MEENPDGSVHLRPHPTSISEKENIHEKFKLRKSKAYFYAFSETNYCDIEIFNKLEKPCMATPVLKYALQYVDIPVIFFMCYDVGYKFGRFVRHVVCCLAVKNTIFVFDMRNLDDIQDGFKKYLETKIEEVCNIKDVKIINLACLKSKCLYLQRFKGKYEFGWCIAHALYFLNHLVSHPKIVDMTEKEKTQYFMKLYDTIYSRLKNTHNLSIEEFYTEMMS